MESNDHRIEWSAIDDAVVNHDEASVALNSLRNTWAASHENTLTWHDQVCSSDRRTDNVPVGPDSNVAECGNVILKAINRVICHEDHPTTRCAESGNRITRSRNRLSAQPNHSIKVTQHRASRNYLVIDHV
jgi:hypothetical protein